MNVVTSFHASRVARNMEFHGEFFAMERANPLVFEGVLSLMRDLDKAALQRDALEALRATLDNKVKMGIRLSVHTDDLHYQLTQFCRLVH